ncbi:MAG: hypothetical protein KJI69_03585 [Patescibacteria group bacterium]|nr:hypothetical protein [Patescibacteria group bacterium]
MSQYELDEHPDEHDPKSQYLSVEGLISVAEELQEKFPEKEWFGDYGNVLQVASYLVWEEYELQESKELLYLFEKPHKYYREFIESQVWYNISSFGGNHFFSEKEFDYICDIWGDFRHEWRNRN